MTKFVCISDTHSKERKLDMPPGDILLHSGDISYAPKADLMKEKKQLIDFSEWLGEQEQYSHVVVIAGNHDFMFEKHEEEAIDILTKYNPNVHYLNQTSVELDGFKIYGEPRQPRFWDWAFNVSKQNMKHVWELVPNDVDVLVTHGPPLGYGDVVVNDAGFDSIFSNDSFERVGCEYMRKMLDERKDSNPFKLVTFGHIHEGHGQWFRPKGKTHVVNASVVDKHYKAVNSPIVIELNNE